MTLYKLVRGRTHYWEAWRRDGKLWVHTGSLGHYGKIEKRNERAATAEAAARADGYEPRAADRELVVQYPHALAGAADGQAFREEMYALLNNRLGWIGNGRCDRGDAGRMAMNMICEVVDPALAVKPIVADLRKAKRSAGVMIATRGGRRWQVLWPAGAPAFRLG